MKEYPIIFSTAMIPLILEGKKTQTINSEVDKLDFTTELKRGEDGLWYWILKKKNQ